MEEALNDRVYKISYPVDASQPLTSGITEQAHERSDRGARGRV